MFPTTRIHLFSWLFAKSMGLTNWSRIQLAKANTDRVQMLHSMEPPAAPMEVIFDEQPGFEAKTPGLDWLEKEHDGRYGS